jgi:hypothetical protein
MLARHHVVSCVPAVYFQYIIFRKIRKLYTPKRNETVYYESQRESFTVPLDLIHLPSPIKSTRSRIAEQPRSHARCQKCGAGGRRAHGGDVPRLFPLVLPRRRQPHELPCARKFFAEKLAETKR